MIKMNRDLKECICYISDPDYSKVNSMSISILDQSNQGTRGKWYMGLAPISPTPYIVPVSLIPYIIWHRPTALPYDSTFATVLFQRFSFGRSNFGDPTLYPFESSLHP